MAYIPERLSVGYLRPRFGGLLSDGGGGGGGAVLPEFYGIAVCAYLVGCPEILNNFTP